jgi:hypothetical protein
LNNSPLATFTNSDPNGPNDYDAHCTDDCQIEDMKADQYHGMIAVMFFTAYWSIKTSFPYFSTVIKYQYTTCIPQGGEYSICIPRVF